MTGLHDVSKILNRCSVYREPSMHQEGLRAMADELACSVLAAPLSEDESAALAAGFAALADPGRLRLLSLIADRPEVCACALAEPLGKSQPTVSHHLKVLAEA